ncbi:unnamed protein product [Prorocentrum cordatum]|uniref:Solute carrier family 40 protein n=1 Tax=Prorocentrum cordatum TaxID=2364126 RepID=A0ABN9YFU4_9DINO|nr:unnamed protein product [Polarella glacialis]
MACLQSDQDTRLAPLLPRSKSWVSVPRPLRLRSFFSLSSSPQASNSEDADFSNTVETPAVRAQWWKVVPIDVLKIGGLMLVLPTLTNVKTRFFNGNTAKAARVQSVMDSSRAVFTILVTVQLGQLSDAIGRRPLVVLSVLCTAVPLMCLSFSDNLWYYFVAFAAAGALGGQSSPASQAYVADCCPQKQRARIFGMQGALTTISFIFLPILGSSLEYLSGQGALYITAVGIEILAISFACFLPESLPQEKRRPYSANGGLRVAIVQPLRKLFSRRGSVLWDLAVIKCLKGMTIGAPISFAMASLLDFADADFAVLLTISGIGQMLVQTVFLKFILAKGCSEITLVLFSFGVGVCFYSGMCFLSVWPWKMSAFLLTAFDSFTSVYYPALVSLITTGQEDLGFVLAAFMVVDEITAVMSPLVMGGAYQISFIAPFIVCVALNAICLILSARLRARVMTREGVALAPGEIDNFAEDAS